MRSAKDSKREGLVVFADSGLLSLLDYRNVREYMLNAKARFVVLMECTKWSKRVGCFCKARS